MHLWADVKEAVAHLVFPHVCAACGTDALDAALPVCIACLHLLPRTGFEKHIDNPVEKIFWGRLPVAAATAQYYFTKAARMQRLMHAFKYKGEKETGIFLGRQMGLQLAATQRFNNVDALVPLPLFPRKEKQRGYNQAQLLCEGIAQVLQLPLLTKAVVRTQHTESQTHRSRNERWQNIEGKFAVQDESILKSKRLLLVDDVLTTGATLEACSHALLEVEGLQLSIATLCVAGD